MENEYVSFHDYCLPKINNSASIRSFIITIDNKTQLYESVAKITVNKGIVITNFFPSNPDMNSQL